MPPICVLNFQVIPGRSTHARPVEGLIPTGQRADRITQYGNRGRDVQGEFLQGRQSSVAVAAIIPHLPFVEGIRQTTQFRRGHSTTLCSTDASSCIPFAQQDASTCVLNFQVIPGRSTHARPVEGLIPTGQRVDRITQYGNRRAGCPG